MNMHNPTHIKFHGDKTIYPIIDALFDSENILTYFVRMEDNSIEGFSYKLAEVVFYDNIPDLSGIYGPSHFRVIGMHNAVNPPVKGSIIMLCSCPHCREGKKLILGMPSNWHAHDIPTLD